MVPKRILSASTLKPSVKLTAVIPSASAVLESIAIARSPVRFVKGTILSKIKAAMITTGSATKSDFWCKKNDNAIAPKATCESPSPIMLKR